MKREEVFTKTVKVIQDCMPDLRTAELHEDTVINNDAAIDSMGFILIICKLEALFDIRIPQKQWNKMKTLGDVIDAIMKRLPAE